ncbi:MAG: DNA translocase FtsK 4TM domain-containing protein, partial [Pseudomonadota bacterium]
MAYQTHGRDPLLDQNMQAALERRGRELIGILLVILGLMAVLMIVSYSPDDPNWMMATDAPVQNWLGRAGATLAAPLFMIVGWGALGIGILFMAWGARFALDWGRERAFSRLIFAPIAVALASVYAATLQPPAEWSHSFGLGGLFGDTVLLMVLQIIPGTAALGAKMISLLTGVMIFGLAAFVLGFTW